VTSSSQFRIPVLCAVLALSAGAWADSEPWSLRPVVKKPVPTGENPVDWFVQAQLDEAGLGQNAPADRYTLLRRITLDLTGLPPTREEIALFIADESPDAWRNLVDRLLASPHYGERWGRHWLDIARYVQGTIQVPGIDSTDLAMPYRDYVVRSFNSDKPYDQFVTEQLAGDLLPESEKGNFDRIIAPAFLSIGQWFDECTDPNKLRLDIIDEQISTATRAFLAMDFACARCHDHKFDPIPTRDYYALAGMFRSTEVTEYFSKEWKDGRPRAVSPLAEDDYFGEAERVAAERKTLLGERETILLQQRERIAIGEGWTSVIEFEAEDFAGHKNLKTKQVGDLEVLASRRRLDQWAKYRILIPGTGPYTLMVRYAAAEPSPVELEIEGNTNPERVLGEPTYGESPQHFRWEAIPLGQLKEGSCHIRLKVKKNEPFPSLDRFQLIAGSPKFPTDHWNAALGEPALADTIPFLDAVAGKKVEQIEADIATLDVTLPSPELTLSVTDSPDPGDLAVHPGGDVYRTEGDPVPRGVPSMSAPIPPENFAVPLSESGRLQFAEWLTDPANPVAARVMVNRIWHWHFGTGLVRTTDDFGRQGIPPTHPELLDWLAAEFIESGWSVKHIQRLILNSDTYRASSERNELDPDSTLLTHFPRRRLEVETIYDSMLTTIGKVPRQEPATPLDTSKSKDRALYILTSSRSPLGLGVEIRKMFPLFGFDISGRPMHTRDSSVTSEQALWWLNNPLPRYYADKFAELTVAAYPDTTERVQHIHETILGRPADNKTAAAMIAYAKHGIDNAGLTEPQAWSRVCLGLFSSKAFSHLE